MLFFCVLPPPNFPKRQHFLCFFSAKAIWTDHFWPSPLQSFRALESFLGGGVKDSFEEQAVPVVGSLSDALPVTYDGGVREGARDTAAQPQVHRRAAWREGDDPAGAPDVCEGDPPPKEGEGAGTAGVHVVHKFGSFFFWNVGSCFEAMCWNSSQKM